MYKRNTIWIALSLECVGLVALLWLVLSPAHAATLRQPASSTVSWPVVISEQPFNLNLTHTLFLPISVSTCDPVAEDCYEPNDAALMAFGPITTGIAYVARIDESADASDYFSITLTSGVKYVIRTTVLSSANNKKDIDLYLYDRPNHIIQQSDQANTGDETITFQPSLSAPDQLLYIRIYAFSAEQTVYQLRVDVD